MLKTEELLFEALAYVERSCHLPCVRTQKMKTPKTCAENGDEPCRWCVAPDLRARILEHLGTGR